MTDRILKPILLLVAGLLFFVSSVALGSETPRDLSVRSLVITGTIALVKQGYIIQGTSPHELFTILNPDEEILGNYIRSERPVTILARLVSGDNVEIITIDGRDYLKGP